MQLGNYPTPVEQIPKLSNDRCTLWVKRDDRTNSVYGGNKVRKLEHLIREAHDRGAKRIVTFGAAGSHHVLATTLHATMSGLRVAAVLTPQPFSQHGRDNLRAALAAGLEAFPAPRIALVPWVLAKIVRRKDYVVPPGGSNIIASMGYADAAVELANQVSAGVLPEPDVIVVALGSGGTAAGLVAGLEETVLRCPVHAVRVVEPPLMTEPAALLLARGVVRRRSRSPSMRALRRRMVLVSDRLGRGYAYPTSWGEQAMERAATCGLVLEPTYTAKAFSHALRLVDEQRYRNVLYWHTLSSTVPCGAGPEIPVELERLWL